MYAVDASKSGKSGPSGESKVLLTGNWSDMVVVLVGNTRICRLIGMLCFGGLVSGLSDEARENCGTWTKQGFRIYGIHRGRNVYKLKHVVQPRCSLSGTVVNRLSC